MSDSDLAPPRADGFIALRRIKIGNIMTPEVNGHQYLFLTQHDIALAWIDPNDVAGVLMVKCGCCGNRNICFRLATVGDVATWSAQ